LQRYRDYKVCDKDSTPVLFNGKLLNFETNSFLPQRKKIILAYTHEREERGGLCKMTQFKNGLAVIL